MYNTLLKQQLKKVNVDFAQLDLTHDMPELCEFDPNAHLRRLAELYQALEPDQRAQIAAGDYESFGRMPGVDELRRQVEQFLRQFGHLSDSGTDCSSVPWRERPDVALKLIAHQSLQDLPSTAPKIKFEDIPFSPLRRWLLAPMYRRARSFRLYREALSSLYTLGYGLHRPYLLALGDHFARRGVLAARDDIFFLYLDEIRALVEQGQADSRQELVATRKREMDACRNVSVPELIYGDEPPPVDVPGGDRLTGIPTSQGYYTGKARVVCGIQDFGKVQPGDVLVIPFSDVGWTPLFAKAGAVIAESGGMLSHSSIVAREYGLPAVVSVAGACRLQDDTLVTVDGFKGEIVLHAAQTEAPEA
jgi:pyruvate,water dikinase